MLDPSLYSNQGKPPHTKPFNSHCMHSDSALTPPGLNTQLTHLTGGAVVYQSSQGFAILPVTVEVVDGQLGHLVLYPTQQALFGGQLLGLLVILVIPHGHGDRVMEDQSPDKTQDQL